MGGRPRSIFEIFQNGHIFLKFLFLKNIKKKKPRVILLLGWRGPIIGRAALTGGLFSQPACV